MVFYFTKMDAFIHIFRSLCHNAQEKTGEECGTTFRFTLWSQFPSVLVLPHRRGCMCPGLRTGGTRSGCGRESHTTAFCTPVQPSSAALRDVPASRAACQLTPFPRAEWGVKRSAMMAVLDRHLMIKITCNDWTSFSWSVCWIAAISLCLEREFWRHTMTEKGQICKMKAGPWWMSSWWGERGGFKEMEILCNF